VALDPKVPRARSLKNIVRIEIKLLLRLLRLMLLMQPI
jgi:hypothetical protein